eukprot:6351563-Amphidinium_carterae.1
MGPTWVVAVIRVWVWVDKLDPAFATPSLKVSAMAPVPSEFVASCGAKVCLLNENTLLRVAICALSDSRCVNPTLWSKDKLVNSSVACLRVSAKAT